MNTNKRLKGFTLIEMLLVLVIIGVILFAGIRYTEQKTLQMRIDRTTLQTQQILNAALSYYVNNGFWPTSLQCLYGTLSAPCSIKYIPEIVANNPWGSAYQTYSNANGTTRLFYVWSAIPGTAGTGTAAATATVISGSLPLAYTSNDIVGTPPSVSSPCSSSDTNCNAVSSVNIPGQNLSNANAINYAGLYHHGACVPVPSCPSDAAGNPMTPEIMVAPVSVSGVNDPSPNSSNVYPISSFTAYATEGLGQTLTNQPLPCTIGGQPAPTSGAACDSTDSTPIGSGFYWRVCLQVVTERGDVSQTNNSAGTAAWGQYVTLLAVTRCAPFNEPTGSDFTVYTQ